MHGAMHCTTCMRDVYIYMRVCIALQAGRHDKHAWSKTCAGEANRMGHISGELESERRGVMGDNAALLRCALASRSAEQCCLRAALNAVHSACCVSACVCVIGSMGSAANQRATAYASQVSYRSVWWGVSSTHPLMHACMPGITLGLRGAAPAPPSPPPPAAAPPTCPHSRQAWRRSARAAGAGRGRQTCRPACRMPREEGGAVLEKGAAGCCLRANGDASCLHK